MVQVANVTRGVLRIRLTFQELPTVITNRRSPRSLSKAAQIGVGLGRPSLVKVVNRMYWDLARSAKVGVTLSNLTREQTQSRTRMGFRVRLCVCSRGRTSPRDHPRFPAAPGAGRRGFPLPAWPTCRGRPLPAGVRPYRAAPTDWTRP